MRIQGKWLLVCCWQVFFCVQTDAATSETSSPPLSCDGQVVPDAWINDGYCDCSDGSDETTTEACSGHEYWPGHAEEEVVVKQYFSCVKQPEMKLSLSKVNDGICDCCDGSDETANDVCQDDCEAIFEQQRQALAQMQRKFVKGYTRRMQEIEDYEKVKVEVGQEVQVKQGQLDEVQAALAEVREKLAVAKMAFVEKYLERMTVLANGPLMKSMFDPLSDDELFWFIIHACQLAGEMNNNASNGETTCEALRLAGIDVALSWSDPGESVTRMMGSTTTTKENNNMATTLADIVYHNLHNQNKIWKLSNNGKGANRRSGSSSNRRKLLAEEEVEHMYDGKWNDDDFEVTLMDDDDNLEPLDESEVKLAEKRKEREERVNQKLNEMDDDEIVESAMNDDDSYNYAQYSEDDPEIKLSERSQQRKERVRQMREKYQNGDEEDDEASKEDEKYKEIRERRFSAARASLLDQAAKILKRIDDMTKDTKDEQQEESEQPETNFDPLALPMVSSQLRKLEKNIRQGFDSALAAKKMLDSLAAEENMTPDKKRSDLKRLAVGTLRYGMLSPVLVWQIYQGILAEVLMWSIEDERETCYSAWSTSCPPQEYKRKGGATLPPPAILEAGESFCGALYGEAAAEACAPNDKEIPSQITDGFMGYFSPEPRGDEDVLSLALLDDGTDKDSLEELADLIEKESDVASKESELSDEIKKLKGKLGEDGVDFGPDGELYSIRESCFDIPTGKYTYELCMFGAASQKEKKGQGRGTNLGQWSEATIDEETGQRIWKWTNGQRCWNGPTRSATAYVTCGHRTKIVSAEEPETCTYEMQVESHVACDEAYRLRHGLELTLSGEEMNDTEEL